MAKACCCAERSVGCVCFRMDAAAASEAKRTAERRRRRPPRFPGTPSDAPPRHPAVVFPMRGGLSQANGPWSVLFCGGGVSPRCPTSRVPTPRRTNTSSISSPASCGGGRLGA